MVTKLLRPDEVEQYRANGWDVRRNLYELRKVSAAERSNAFKAAKARSKKVALADKSKVVEPVVKVAPAFEEKYASIESALPDACEAMLNLNRYAKHRECLSSETDEIYDIKYGLVRALYATGHCIECVEQQTPGKTCYNCDGTGNEAVNLVAEDWYDCNRCGGSGWYHKPSTLLRFTFKVAGVPYCWHVPSENVEFSYALTANGLPWEESSEDKPIALPLSKFPEAKALVRWVTSGIEKSMGLGTFGNISSAAA